MVRTSMLLETLLWRFLLSAVSEFEDASTGSCTSIFKQFNNQQSIPSRSCANVPTSVTQENALLIFPHGRKLNNFPRKPAFFNNCPCCLLRTPPQGPAVHYYGNTDFLSLMALLLFLMNSKDSRVSVDSQVRQKCCRNYMNSPHCLTICSFR